VLSWSLFAVRATVDKVQSYCFALEFIVVTSTVDIVQWYYVVLEFIVDTTKLYIVQRSFCCVWSLLWLQQQKI